MIAKLSKLADLAVVSALGVALTAAPAFADGMARRGSIKDAPAPEARRCALSANVALATEYVFRGISQTAEDPAIQGGFDATCGMFYAGVWASNVDFGSDLANIEMDWYAGIKPKTGPVTWDLGVIYYSYPGSDDPILLGLGGPRDLNFVELKVGASTEVWKGGTVGATVFFSPDYQLESGDVWTIEGAFSQSLPTIGMFTPTFSALLGYQTGDDLAYRTAFANGEDHYFYWNAGVTFAFLEKWSLDLRYWDTSIDNNNASGGFSNGFCTGAVLQCDERFVATLKFTY